MADISVDELPTIAPDRMFALPARHIFAVVAGNALEFYDFVIYSYFAVYIGKTFFPAYGPGSSLLLSLATFGAGFLTRPVGAIVIGAMGDRVGRKPAMMLSFALMGVSILGLALTPSFAAIGLAAPILVLIFRLLQGFALGGEVGPSTAFMVEAAPLARRGVYAGLQPASQNAALLLGGVTGTILAALLSAQQLQDWGWRLAMLVGAAIVPFGLAVRKSLPETLHADPLPDMILPVEAPIAPRRWPYARIAVLGLLILMAGTIGTYTGAYMTTYALTTLGLPATASFGVVIVKQSISVPFILLGGWLSDRFGRKPVIIAPAILLWLSIVPIFFIISRYRTVPVFYLANVWLTILSSSFAAPVFTTIVESLPRSIRSGAMAMIYAFAISIFGGSTQFILAWLLKVTGNPMAPAYYWFGAVTIGLIAMTMLKESAPVSRRKRIGA